jgi:hypothetical protein
MGPEEFFKKYKGAYSMPLFEKACQKCALLFSFQWFGIPLAGLLNRQCATVCKSLRHGRKRPSVTEFGQLGKGEVPNSFKILVL